MNRMKSSLICALLIAGLAACRQDMHDQPKSDPLEKSVFFKDGRASRPLVEGTVARGHLKLDEHFYTGKVNGVLATTFPFPVTMEVLQRGRDRFDIYCAPCHSKVGDGRGMIVQRGMKQPESYHSQRLREIAVGHFFDVMTNGFGAMYSYSERVSPQDRWAIAAYIRVLQLSQGANLRDLPAQDQQLIQQVEVTTP
ncbi:MAG: cytochrome c [candidate division Zixibacteria bacterium]|nr:cytochrome c [candidate division Zixibacteria bacterium]